MTRLEGLTALVTGADRGIGKGIALELASRGCRVAVNYHRTSELADATVAEIQRIGADAMAVQGDVGVASSVADMFARVLDRFGRIDLHVNNAGVQTWKPLLDVSEEEWDLVIDTNLKGCFLCTQTAARHMKDRGGGSIVNIGSGCNKVAFPDLVAYTASKGGIEMFTKVAAVELGPHKIRVNCVAPGAVEGDRIDRVIAGQAQQRGITPDQMRAAMLERSPLRRMTTADDIADATLFMASDLAKNISGQVIAVNAGEPAG